MKNENNLPNFIEQISYQMHRDRIFSNNPLVMQGMGLAPMVIVATSAKNAAMLAVAVLLLLTPTRVLASILLRNVKGTLWRVMGYTGIAGVVYMGMYWVLERLFGNAMLSLGIYLPLLVVEPLIIYRFGRVPEPIYKAAVKGLRMTVGYAILLAIVGCLREILASGTIYGISLVAIKGLPLATTPAGGFLLLGVVCAIWRGFTNRHRKRTIMKARLER